MIGRYKMATRNNENDTDNSNRGFASMDPEKQREIASQGGKAAHESGNAHEFTSEEAREAGRAAHRSGNAPEFTSEEAREAGARSHINDDSSGGRGRGSSRDDDDDDRGGRSGGRGSNRTPARDEQGRFTSR